VTEPDTSSRDATSSTLKRDLDALVRRARKGFVSRAAAVERSDALRLVPALLLVVPGLVLTYQAIQHFVGMPRVTVPWWGLALATVAVPALYLLMRLIAFERPTLGRADALASFDDAIGSKDLLLAADEFRREETSHGESRGFKDAVLEEAATAMPQALGVEVPGGKTTAPAFSEWLRLGGAAALGVLLVTLLGQPASVGAPGAAATTEVAEAPTEEPEVRPPDRDPTQGPEPVKPEPREPDTRKPLRESTDATPRPLTDLSDEMREAQGKTQSGQSAAAESTSGANDSRGAPSNQGPSGKPNEQKNKPVKPGAPKPKKPDTDDEKKPEEESLQESGSTSGRGASKGSNKNPVASDWKSKDQVAPDEEDDIEDDEEVDDDESESEARGGMQPNLRDRRPPVSRDLSIGFGNQPSPDANGRGGPSEGKKSRGVASLVLGVPIPDRIKGQPNPGRTKVTQERVEPRGEPADAAVAEARTPRAAPVGHRPVPELSPWWRSFLRTYFLRQRAAPEDQR